jgi:hypothetical protein
VDDTGPNRDLEQAIRDERARRRAAEGRIEELTDRADLWRRRAEERSSRIERILEDQAEKEKRFGFLRRLLTRGKPAEAVSESATTETPLAGSTNVSVRDRSASRPRPSISSVMVVAAVEDPGLARCLSAFDSRPFSTATPTDLESADLVVVEPKALAAEPGGEERLASWAGGIGRQPLVVWATGEDISNLSPLLGRGDVVAAADPDIASALDAPHLPGCFDPALHHPRRPGASESVRDEEERDGARLSLDGEGRPLLVRGGEALLSAPPLWLIEAAASGAGFDVSDGAGTAARRWAYRHHAPWARASRLLEMAGVHAPDPIPRIAGILISNRPKSVPAAIARILAQTHAATELVVGIHGAAIGAEIERALAAASIPTELIALDAGLTLGECLNRAISRTSAPLLAKIDDDDHYGPAHLEDGFHALSYSGAGIVGKGAQYTYIASRDSTVLRRPGQEEMLIEGSPNGATLVFRRSVWDEVGFPHRPRHVDTGFLRAARSVGATVYAGSRWEFCYVRRPEGHTWEADDSVFLTGSEPAWDGFHPERVEVTDVDPG